MIKVDNAIESLECFNHNRLLSLDEISRYTNYFCLDNNLCGEQVNGVLYNKNSKSKKTMEVAGNSVDVVINYGLGYDYLGKYDVTEDTMTINFTEIINNFVKNTIKKDRKKVGFLNHLKNNYNPVMIKDIYDLSDSEITLCNLKVLECLNHELFHLLTVQEKIKYLNKQETCLDDSVIHYLALSGMNHAMDNILSDPLYKNGHDLFYEEYLAITYSYLWTSKIADKIGLSKEEYKQFNKDAYNRLSKLYSDISGSKYVNINYDKDGIKRDKASSVSEFNDIYQSNLKPRCLDVNRLPLKEGRKVLKNETKLENSYYNNFDDLVKIFYLIDKEVYFKTIKAVPANDSLLHGFVDVNKAKEIFDGSIDNNILSTNMFKDLDSKKTKIKD